MKLIAHRGNIDGPNPSEENKPEYIEAAIDQGYDVEIDIRYYMDEEQFYLGHDESQYLVSKYFLEQNIEKMWIHCKNLEALYEFSKMLGYNYFWHQEDDYTLTSKNYIWTYPGKSYTPKSIILMPELEINLENFDSLKVYNCFGFCSDYVGKIL